MKAKDSEIKLYLLCLGDILKDFTVKSRQKKYNTVDVSDVIDTNI